MRRPADRRTALHIVFESHRIRVVSNPSRLVSESHRIRDALCPTQRSRIVSESLRIRVIFVMVIRARRGV